MKKNNPIILQLALLLILLFFAGTILTIGASAVLAAENDYRLLEGIPGFAKPGEVVDFPVYIMYIYKFGLWTIGICAMLMIMIGGYMYLTSAGNTSSTGKAKGIITDAVIGLVLALSSYLLLYIINPDLVKFKSLVKEPSNQSQQCQVIQ